MRALMATLYVITIDAFNILSEKSHKVITTLKVNEERFIGNTR